MLLRHRMIKMMRDYFDELGFIDVETPMLGRSTPEGARDYLVPSRVQPGMFYALPQSPQLYKQILMVAGYDRYVQIARCFRDEDLRADRQPEFTQLDLEMSFVDADDVIGVIDGLVARLAKEILGIEVSLPLPRMTYDEAMERFGHDAPDLRFGMELVDLTDLAAEAEFRVFREAAESGGRVRGINAKGAAGTLFPQGHRRADRLRRRELRRQGAGAGSRSKPTARWPRRSPRTSRRNCWPRSAGRMDAEPGDLLLFVADKFEVTCKALYGLRKRLAAELKLYDPATMHFSWVVEFPMFAYDGGGRLGGHAPSVHRSADRRTGSCWPPTRASAGPQAYDLVINGSEAGGGTIRIHDQQLQQQVFGLLGIDEADGPRAVRVPAGRAAIRRPAARRHRPGHRPAGDALRRVGQHPRLHRVPQDPTATDLMTGAPGRSTKNNSTNWELNLSCHNDESNRTES